MNNNEYDFDMDWPEEFAEYANLPPLSDEALNGIITAIKPVMRRIRVKRRVKAGLKAASAMTVVGLCMFTAVTMIHQGPQNAVPSTEMVKLIPSIPEEKNEPSEKPGSYSSSAPVKRAGTTQLPIAAVNKPARPRAIHYDERLSNQGIAQQAKVTAPSLSFSKPQATLQMINAEDIAASQKQAWKEAGEAPQQRPADLAITVEEAGIATDKTLPK